MYPCMYICISLCVYGSVCPWMIIWYVIRYSFNDHLSDPSNMCNFSIYPSLSPSISVQWTMILNERTYLLTKIPSGTKCFVSHLGRMDVLNPRTTYTNVRMSVKEITFFCWLGQAFFFSLFSSSPLQDIEQSVSLSFVVVFFFFCGLRYFFVCVWEREKVRGKRERWWWFIWQRKEREIKGVWEEKEKRARERVNFSKALTLPKGRWAVKLEMKT